MFVFALDFYFPLSLSAKGSKMKTHKSLSTLLVVTFALAPQLLNTSPGALAAQTAPPVH
jgi:hypothetical protein